MTEHVIDDLELYAIGALTPTEAERVTAHLVGCAACRVAAEDLSAVVSTLPDALPERDVAPALRERILTTAAAGRSARRRPRARWLVARRRLTVLIGTLAAALLLLLALEVSAVVQLQRERTEAQEYQGELAKVSGSGRSWYMSGKDDFVGSGGTLIVKQTDASAIVLFHDLHPIDADKHLTVWLVSADGRWIRAVAFRPNGQKLQEVELQTQVNALFDRCAVTLDPNDGPRGRTVMESRISSN